METYNLFFVYQKVDTFSSINNLYKRNQEMIFEGYLYQPRVCMIHNTLEKNYKKQYFWMKLCRVYS